MAEHRLPDRGQVLTRDGQEWTVVDLTSRYVRLLGPSGTLDVPVWDWPQGFQTEEEFTIEAPRIRAILVGGASGRHLDRLEAAAAQQGVDIVAHWPSDLRRVPSKRIPGQIDLVVWLVSHLDHSMYDATKLMARDQGLPCASVPSQGFAGALQSELRRLGLSGGSGGGSYGTLPVARPAEGRYVWTGSTWTWQESLPQAAGRAQVAPVVMAVAAGLLLASRALGPRPTVRGRSRRRRIRG